MPTTTPTRKAATMRYAVAGHHSTHGRHRKLMPTAETAQAMGVELLATGYRDVSVYDTETGTLTAVEAAPTPAPRIPIGTRVRDTRTGDHGTVTRYDDTVTYVDFDGGDHEYARTAGQIEPIED